MRIIGNVLWLLLAGLELAVAYFLAGLVAFVLIITIPFGIASLRLASFVVWPFGRTAVRRDSAGVGSIVGNVLWVILFGWWLALAHVVTGLLLMITIIGIPFGVANFKLVPLALFPLGREIVPIEVARQRQWSGYSVG